MPWLSRWCDTLLDRQQLLAAGADYVETTVLDTQWALVQVGLTLGRPAPESPSTLVPRH